MNTDYSKKFKDRTPEETIKIIEDFFSSLGLTLKEDHMKAIKFTDLCWESAAELYYDDIKILRTCGKGTSELFCRASAYAEMYERFCNMQRVTNDERLIKLIQTNNFKNKNYYWAKDEKLVSKFEDLLTDSNFNTKFKNEGPYIDLLLDKKFTLVPFKSVLDDSTNYYNQMLMDEMAGSNGMAAGNTLEEALVQSISELFEREGISYLVEHLNENYHVISNDFITDPILKGLLNDIESSHNKVVIIDLSYNIKMPVIVAFFININNMKITTTLGAHPLFNIAVERCLTEQYQGYRNEIENLDWEIEQKLSISNSLIKIQDLLENQPEVSNILPESLFLDATIESAPSNIFLTKDSYTNIELLDYCKVICKTNNIEMYYRDKSQCAEMKAIQTYSPQFHVLGLDKFNNSTRCSNLSKMLERDLSQYDRIYSLFDFKFKLRHSLLGYFVTPEIQNIENKFAELFDMPFNDQVYELIKIYPDLLRTPYANIVGKYIALLRYKVIGYSRVATQKLFNYFGLDFTADDWDRCGDYRYICKHVLYPEYKKIYTEEKLLKILDCFIK